LINSYQYSDYETNNWNDIGFEYFQFVSNQAGILFRYIFAGLIGIMAVFILFFMKGSMFARTYTLAGGKGKGPSLAHYQALHWRVFKTGASFNPDDTSNENEAQSMTPMEWMKKNNVTLTESDGLDEGAAYEGFIQQLGKPWHGYQSSETYIKVLCFLMYSNAKRDKNARKYKEDFAIIWTENKHNVAAKKSMKYLKQLLKKDNTFEKMIEKHTSKHAYTNTALYKLLTWSRKNGGVFASAEFRWLKAIDRTLWYALNNCGRRAFHTEGAGVISHYHAENILGQALAEPHVDQAIDGLEDYLDDQGIMDLEEFFKNEFKEF
jgi:hypothetical protein